MRAAPELVLSAVEVAGRRVDVVLAGGRVQEIVPAGEAATHGVEVVAGAGGALLPGLHDHHLHLLALAAAGTSVAVGPGAVGDRADLSRALRAAPASTDGWIRAVGYHESVAGPLDRWVLDELEPDRPVRVQHRTGAAWFLSSSALARLGLAGPAGDRTDVEGVELDALGRPTGRIYGNDLLVRGSGPAPDLAPVGRTLASYGVTGVTDATPYAEASAFDPLVAAIEGGALPQQVVVTGGPALAGATVPAALGLGPVKLVVADHGLPDLDGLAGDIDRAHRHGRPVAVHCVTRAGLVLALAAWDQAGPRRGDRVEHASVAPPELRTHMARLGLTVVTQPSFVAERGDQYLTDVDDDDIAHLYPCRSLEADGVPVGGSTDAPYASADPWRAVRAAVDRRTTSGAILGRGERLAPGRSLELFLTPPDDPGGPPRRVEVGAPADLCLLAVTLDEALRAPSSTAVRATFRGGRRIH